MMYPSQVIRILYEIEVSIDKAQWESNKKKITDFNLAQLNHASIIMRSI